VLSEQQECIQQEEERRGKY